jgi:hypothetical protein
MPTTYEIRVKGHLPTGLTNLLGQAGTSVAIGQGIQVIGVLTALLAGVIAT